MALQFESPTVLENVVYIKLKGGAGSYLKLPVLTTAQRNRLSATAGTFIFNSTTNQVEAYTNGSWSGWTGGGEVPTWTQDHNAAGYSLLNAIIDGGSA